MQTGIYKILNRINNKFYIGSSVNIQKRWKDHIRSLNLNKNGCRILQMAWNKYGNENFEFCILEFCERSALISREQFYINTLKPEYNICLTAKNNIGIRRTDEFRNKIKIANKGKILGAATKIKMGTSKKGNQYFAKFYKGFIDPNGIVYKDIFNLSRFCKEHGLYQYRMCNLNSGKISKYKGWKLLEQ